MKLIRKLNQWREFPSGKQRLGEFECPYCLTVCVKTVPHGRRDNSCGCALNKGENNGRFDHGLCKHRVYWLWSAMHQRCENPNSQDYPRYGGRGISVCAEWSDVAVFAQWALANGWKEGLKIDRIDNDGNYTPDNCCFTTNQINCQHSSKAKINLAIARKIKELLPTGTRKEVAAKAGVSYDIVFDIARGRTWRNA